MRSVIYIVATLVFGANALPQIGKAGGASNGGGIVGLLGNIMREHIDRRKLFDTDHGVEGINIMPGGSETPNSFILWDPENPGSGPYPAKAFSDPSLPKRTIYAPKTPSKEKLPVILWGNGACLAVGTMFSGFLKEIASHGFLVIANGALSELPSIPAGGMKGNYKKNPLGSLFQSAPPSSTSALPTFLTSGMSNYTWQIASANWAQKGAAGGKYGIPDMSKVAVAGQSCGGMEAYQVTAKDSRIRATALFNSGTLRGGRDQLKLFKGPVGIFNGGPKDLAYKNGEEDFKHFPQGLPVVKANLDAGHLGTYFAKNGGKFGKIAVAFFKATLKDDHPSKQLFASSGPFTRDKWEVVTRNWLN